MTSFPSNTHNLVTRENGARDLHKRAGAVRDEVFGSRVFVRGVVEISNFCRQNCDYCGMRRDNRNLERYRLSLEKLQEMIRRGLPDTITDLNLQMGEDPVGIREIVLPLIETLRRETSLGISVCLGTLDFKLYDELRQAGASYYIIKLETGNRDHYRQVHAPGTFEQRLKAIRYLANTGWAVSSGFILGLPGQTSKHIEESLNLLHELPLAGASVSPFIAGEETPLVGHPSGGLETTIDCIASLRLRNPTYVIPAISALNILAPEGYVQALKAGANLATINLTPSSERGEYLLYKKDRFIMHEERVKKAIEKAGCTISSVSIAKSLEK